MKTVLMTGAAGRIGTFLRYKLRLSDIAPIRDLRRRNAQPACGHAQRDHENETRPVQVETSSTKVARCEKQVAVCLPF